jgi:uncharacterized FlaG/YvyC family protein
MQIDSLRNVAHWALAEPSTSPTTQKISEPEMIQAVKAVNEAGLFGQQYELTFAMDRRSTKPLLRLVDRNTHEVVRQIPPEYVLRLARQPR